MVPEKASEKELVVHSRIQQHLKPYGCIQCGKTFAKISYLLRHMHYHQDIRRIGCSYEGCGTRFAVKRDLNDHVRTVHTNERPFKCTVCNKSYLTGSVYYQHRLRHNNDRRYGCDICKKKFFRNDILKNHMRIHTGEKPYNCEICGKNFRIKGTRDRHVWTVHHISL